jgi:hypothetical protein
MIVDIRLKVWTVRQAGEFLPVHAKTVARKAELGIPGPKVGNRWRFMSEVIRAFLLGEDEGPRMP